MKSQLKVRVKMNSSGEIIECRCSPVCSQTLIVESYPTVDMHNQPTRKLHLGLYGDYGEASVFLTKSQAKELLYKLQKIVKEQMI